MGIKTIVSLTTLLLGLLHITNVVSGAGGYCNDTIVIWKISNGYTYRIDYPSNGGSTNCLMNIGAKGNGVKSLQSSLNHCYGQSLAIDGVYGQLTKAAVKVAQKKVGTTQDGVYGPVTGNLISWWSTSINGGAPKCLKV